MHPTDTDLSGYPIPHTPVLDGPIPADWKLPDIDDDELTDDDDTLEISVSRPSKDSGGPL
jgi:hypothetical protein